MYDTPLCASFLTPEGCSLPDLLSWAASLSPRDRGCCVVGERLGGTRPRPPPPPIAGEAFGKLCLCALEGDMS